MNFNSPSRKRAKSEHVRCLTTRQLRAWLEDEREVDPEDLQHLKQCPWCTQSLKDLSDDDGLQLMANISSSKSQPIYSDEPEFTRLRSMLNSWPMDQKDEALGGD